MAGAFDVTFICLIFGFLLAFGSPVFTAMFYGNLKETTPLIPVPDVTTEAFDGMLRYDLLPFAFSIRVTSDGFFFRLPYC